MYSVPTIVLGGGITTFWGYVIEIIESGKVLGGDWVVHGKDIGDEGGELELVIEFGLDDSKFKFVWVIEWRWLLS